MGSRVQQQYFPKLCIISALPIYVTLIMLPENTLGSETWLFLSQSSTRRRPHSHFACQISDLP